MPSRRPPLRTGIRPPFGSAPRRQPEGGPVVRSLPGIVLTSLVIMLLAVPYISRDARIILAASAPPPGPPTPEEGDVAMGNHGGAALQRDPQADGSLQARPEGDDLEVPLAAAGRAGYGDGERLPLISDARPGELELVALSYESGKPRARGYSRDGVRDGRWVEWWENGTQRSEGTYRNDLRHGKWVHWYESGRLREEGMYANGERDGHWETWHESGEHKRRAEYRSGIRDGIWEEWYSDGQLMQSGLFRDGLREGYWEYFHFGARVDRRTGMYRAGRRVR